MNLKSIRIATAAMLKGALLLSVTPQFTYVNGIKSSDTPTGFKYQCVLPSADYEKVSVAIAGEQQMEAPKDGPVPVLFENATMTLWQNDSGVGLTCKADIVKPAGKSSAT